MTATTLNPYAQRTVSARLNKNGRTKTLMIPNRNRQPVDGGGRWRMDSQVQKKAAQRDQKKRGHGQADFFVQHGRSFQNEVLSIGSSGVRGPGCGYVTLRSHPAAKNIEVGPVLIAAGRYCCGRYSCGFQKSAGRDGDKKFPAAIFLFPRPFGRPSVDPAGRGNSQDNRCCP